MRGEPPVEKGGRFWSSLPYFETANESLDSICQIGVASFDSGCLVGSWETLVDPQDDFS